MADNNYRDVNREQYQKIMFTELIGQTAMMHFTEKAKTIFNFTLSNSMKNKGDKVKLIDMPKDINGEVDAYGRVVSDGFIMISSHSWKDKSVKKKMDKKIKELYV